MKQDDVQTWLVSFVYIEIQQLATKRRPFALVYNAAIGKRIANNNKLLNGSTAAAALTLNHHVYSINACLLKSLVHIYKNNNNSLEKKNFS